MKTKMHVLEVTEFFTNVSGPEVHTPKVMDYVLQQRSFAAGKGLRIPVFMPIFRDGGALSISGNFRSAASGGSIKHLSYAMEPHRKGKPGTLEWLIKEAEAAFTQKIPEFVRAILDASGKKIVLADKPPDIGRVSYEPGPHDYYKRSEVEVEGFYAPAENVIFTAASKFCKHADRFEPVEDAALVFAHECAHGLDDTILQISAKPQLAAAHLLDSIVLPDGRYGYQRQTGARGRKEALAEILTEQWLGICVAGEMKRDWTSSYFWTEKYLENAAAIYEHSGFSDPEDALTEHALYGAATEAEARALEIYPPRSQLFRDFAEGLRQGRNDTEILNAFDGEPGGEVRKTLRGMLSRQGKDRIIGASRTWRQMAEVISPPQPSDDWSGARWEQCCW